MEPVNIMLVGVWAFAIVLLVGLLAEGGDMLVGLIVFFIAIAVSAAGVAIPRVRQQQ